MTDEDDDLLRTARKRAVDGCRHVVNGDQEQALFAICEAVVCMTRHLGEPVSGHHRTLIQAFEDGYRSGLLAGKGAS